MLGPPWQLETCSPAKGTAALPLRASNSFVLSPLPPRSSDWQRDNNGSVIKKKNKPQTVHEIYFKVNDIS